MDIYEVMDKRFSVRKYKHQPVEEDKLQRVLNAGRIAPSASNRQKWKFVVVRDDKLRKALSEAAEQPFVGEAPVVIAVVGLGPEEIMSCEIPKDPVDCAIAIDHMTLAAVAEGLGTCWIGHFDQDACCRLLGVPPTGKIIDLLPLGYPDVSQPPAKRKPLEEVVCYDGFS